MFDFDFIMVGYLNFEVFKVFVYLEFLGKLVDVDILFVIDLDCDWVVLEVKDSKGEYIFLNGNKIGVFFFYYIFL